jgi:hypothetical protein
MSIKKHENFQKESSAHNLLLNNDSNDVSASADSLDKSIMKIENDNEEMALKLEKIEE